MVNTYRTINKAIYHTYDFSDEAPCVCVVCHMGKDIRQHSHLMMMIIIIIQVMITSMIFMNIVMVKMFTLLFCSRSISVATLYASANRIL